MNHLYLALSLQTATALTCIVSYILCLFIYYLHNVNKQQGVDLANCAFLKYGHTLRSQTYGNLPTEA